MDYTQAMSHLYTSAVTRRVYPNSRIMLRDGVVHIQWHRQFPGTTPWTPTREDLEAEDYCIV